MDKLRHKLFFKIDLTFTFNLYRVLVKGKPTYVNAADSVKGADVKFSLN